MNFGELKTKLLAYSHRADLSGEAAGFVSLAEGLIRRELRAYETSATLTDSDRVADGLYALPATVDEVRTIYSSDQGVSYSLEQVSATQLRELAGSAPVMWFTTRGSQIEFRGVPGTGATLEVLYLGHPAALSADGDTNDLLTDHPALYLYGALFFLYQYTQDLELAQAALDTFSDTIEKLNQLHGRKAGGASIARARRFSNGSAM
jgi:hypothetical protein